VSSRGFILASLMSGGMRVTAHANDHGYHPRQRDGCSCVESHPTHVSCTCLIVLMGFCLTFDFSMALKSGRFELWPD